MEEVKDDLPPGEAPQNAKELLESLWRELQENVKRNPSKENFAALDSFVEKYQEFFVAGILIPFSYEKLFEQHFPHEYSKKKFLYGAVYTNQAWGNAFLHTCEKAYGAEEKRRQLFLAVKNNDPVMAHQVIEKIKENFDARDLSGISSRIQSIARLYDSVEPDELLECCFVKYGAKEVADIIFNELVAPYASALGEEYVILFALYTHQPIEVIKKYLEELRENQGMGSKRIENFFSKFFFNLTSLAKITFNSCYLEAAELFSEFAKQYQLEFTAKETRQLLFYHDVPVDTVERLITNAKFGAILPDEYLSFIEVASESGHDDVVKYLIKNAEKFNCYLTKEDYESFITLALQGNRFKTAGYLLKKYIRNFTDDESFLRGMLMPSGVDELNVLTSLIILLRQLNNLDDLTASVNQADIEALESLKVDDDEESVRQRITDVILPELRKLLTPAVSRSTLHEAHLSVRENDLVFRGSEPITVENSGSRTVIEFHEWEFVDLVRRAVRNPSAYNAQQVENHLEKHGKDFSPEVKKFYEINKPYFVSPMAYLPPDLLRYTLFKVAQPSAARTSRRFRDVAEGMPLSEFVHRYPREHQRILRANPAGKINWREKLNEAGVRAYVNLPEGHRQLFRAIRDPRREMKAVQAVLQSTVFGYGNQDNMYLLGLDAVEGENIYRCVSRNKWQAVLNAIHARILDCVRGGEPELIAAVLCFQPRALLETCFGKLNREDAVNFERICREALKCAVAAENTEAADFLFEHAKVQLKDALFLNTALTYACEQKSVAMAWWLIEKGADVFSLTPAHRNTLSEGVFEHDKDKKLQGKAQVLLVNIIRAYAERFFVSVIPEETPLRDSAMGKAGIESRAEEREKNKSIYDALKALQNVLTSPTDAEYIEEFYKHADQFIRPELNSVYQLCKPFLPTLAPADMPLSHSPRK